MNCLIHTGIHHREGGVRLPLRHFCWIGYYVIAVLVFQDPGKAAETTSAPPSIDCKLELARVDDLFTALTSTFTNSPQVTAKGLEEVLAVRKSCLGFHHSDTITTAIILGQTVARFDSDKAIQTYKDVLEELKLASHQSREWIPPKLQVLTAMAAAQVDRGSLGTARGYGQLAKKALALSPTNYNFAPTSLDAQVYLASGRIHRALGELVEAAADYKEAERLARNHGDIALPFLGAALANLGGVYRDLGEHSAAISTLEEALRVEAAGGARALKLAMIHDQLCEEYAVTENYVAAKANTLAALAERKDDPLATDIELAMSYNNLGMVFFRERHWIEAITNYHLALKLSESYSKAGDNFRPTFVDNLVSALREAGRYDEALAEAWVSAKLREREWGNILRFTSTEDRLAFRKTRYGIAVAIGGQLARRDPRLLAQTVFRLKGVVLDSVIEDRQLAAQSQATQIQAEVEALQSVRRKWVAARVRGDEEDTGRLEQNIQGREAALSQKFPRIGRSQRALSVTIEDVQRAIPNHAVLVEFVFFLDRDKDHREEARCGALILGAGGGAVRWVDLGTGSQINNMIESYVSTMDRLAAGQFVPGAQGRIAEANQALLNALWSPIVHELPPDTAELIISPDGPINRLPFAGLWTGESFVGERYAIRYVTSGRDLLARTANGDSRSTGDVVIFANPDFDASSTHGDGPAAPFRGVTPASIKIVTRTVPDLSGGGWFPPLTNTEIEASEIARLVRKTGGLKTILYTGTNACEASVYKTHRPYVLHLTTHGHWFDDGIAADSNGWRSERMSIDDSMIRGSIILAGANTTARAWRNGQIPPTDNDGFLMAGETATLDLDGTWLVCLSACRTGVGSDTFGEGVFGLRRAFFLAGARNVVMTLWPVEDQFSTRLMTEFYEEALKPGRDAVDALNKVQARELRRLRGTKDWTEVAEMVAPFVIGTAAQ